jgi:CheY-like chemotaxis protein
MHLVDPGDAHTPLPPVVLVVDDHADTVEMYDALLSAHGYWVERAANATEAFESAHDVRPDAIVTDLGLPGVDGTELIRRLHSDPALHDVPVLAVTGREPKDMPSLAGLGMSAVLLKPVAPETLIARLEAALSEATALRTRGVAALANVESLLARSTALIAQGRHGAPQSERRRACPTCGEQLEWIETGQLGANTYEYYRWCRNKCGLYCFNQTTGSFELLSRNM